jgi:hypothetical protein
LHIISSQFLSTPLKPLNQNNKLITTSTLSFSLHRLCPLLNGTVKQEDGFNNAAFMGAPPTMP